MADCAFAAQVDIAGPPGSGAFGTTVTVLPNGNFVVTDPEWDGTVPNAGAVHLYDPTGSKISTITGSSADDRIGSGQVVVLANGNCFFRSPKWDNGAAIDAGAVTWMDGDTGVSGVVSAANSLVGTTSGDQVGGVAGGVALTNGNYVVFSGSWDKGSLEDVGAVTWADGDTGISGAVSVANSLVGSSPGDTVGGAYALANGNYVVVSPGWRNGDADDAGAITWADGSTGLVGEVSPANSVVGTKPNDLVGLGGVTALPNGNYVVVSYQWSSPSASCVGAVTWGSGNAASSGPVSAANSLIGSTANDLVGIWDVEVLANGNYVVKSTRWTRGTHANAGAVTWGDGGTGTSGVVSEANSLVGSSAENYVGYGGVAELSTGDYVVSSPHWDQGLAQNVGAVTWVNGATGLSGQVSAANSLVGQSAGDFVGGVVALSNGHYVVTSRRWDDGGSTNVGAVTWVNGFMPAAGIVSAENSLIGSSLGDEIGLGVVASGNGDYVVISPSWRNGNLEKAGAITRVSGAAGTVGQILPANSLVGVAPGDQVGGSGATLLGNGNMVIVSPAWDNESIEDAGAVTWLDGNLATTGAISSANSLVGTSAMDLVGAFGVTALVDGNYVVRNPRWDGVALNSGALTLARGDRGLRGPISAENSILGSVAGEEIFSFGYDSMRKQLVAGRPTTNLVSLLALPLFADDFE